MGKYEIYVGRKRETNALIGNLVKGRTDIIQGETRQADIKVGVYGIPNYTQAWGVRLVKGKVPKNAAGEVEPVEADNMNYTGEFKPLKWGDKEGTMIPCRWVSGYSTIDQTYQDLRLKIKMKEDDVNSVMILLNQGYNEFDESRDKSLVEILKVHGANADSVSKHPDYEGEKFKEIKQELQEQKETVMIDDKFACLSIVNEASTNNESIKCLYHIVNGKELNGFNPDDVNDVFKGLKLFADRTPDVFASRINAFKLNVSTFFEKSKVYNILDITKDGELSATDNKNVKHLILSMDGVKGKDMLDYMFSNYLKKEVFDGIDKLKIITDKLK